MKVTARGSQVLYTKQFLPRQQDFMECAAPEVLFSGSFGCGKTRVLCEKILFLCLRYPGNRIGVFRKTAKACRATTIRKLLEPDGDLPPVIPPQLVLQHHKKEAVIYLRTNPTSEIIYGGMDQRGTDGEAWFNSLDFGAIAIDQAEELTEDEFMLLSGRLRHKTQPIQQALMACNPKGKAHWLYRRFFIEQAGDRALVRSKTLDNRFLPPAYMNRLARFTGPYYRRFVEGEWIDLEGIVYPTFDPTIHIKDYHPIPRRWPRFWSVDFGYTSPFCAQLWVVVEDYPPDWTRARLADVPVGSMILYREIYYSRRMTKHHVARMLALAPPTAGADMAVCDWDANGRAELESAGFSTTPAYKSMEEGIQAVMARLGNTRNPNTGEYIQPRIFFMDTALDEKDPKLTIDQQSGKKRQVPTNTCQEFGYYAWPTGRDGMPKKTEQPADEYNHGMDGMRYAVVEVDGHGQVAWIG